MTFNSWEFLLFYPIVAFLYFVLPKKCRWPMLLLASYFFYACYQPDLLYLIFATTLVSWGASLLIARTERRGVRVAALTLTLAVCLGVLFFYKYFNFFSETVRSALAAFGVSLPVLTLDLILPVGISFYTFQTLSYVIDVYRGHVAPERNFFFYALYVSFFPQLVAGPIERPENLIPQLRADHRPERENFLAGGKMMLLGFFKKIAVADLLSAPVTAIYSAPAGVGSLSVLLATLLFAVQIYCDFSGYTDIAIGAARVMGIRLMKNFDHPYRSESVKEFWGRWHISLSSWLRDYLYFPLGGSRCKKWRHLLNLLIVFLASGLWHGASLTFVLWGLVHGVYRVTGEVTLPARRRLLSRLGVREDAPPLRALRRVVTFALVCFAWIFFRAGSVADLGVLLGELFAHPSLSLSGALSHMGVDALFLVRALLSVFLLLILDSAVTYEGGADGSDALLGSGGFVYVLYTVCAAWLLLLSRGEASTFIYFQF